MKSNYCIEKRHRKILSVLSIILLVSMMFLIQGNYVEKLETKFLQRKYGVTQDIMEIWATLNSERAMGFCEEKPTIACPEEVMLQYQKIDEENILIPIYKDDAEIDVIDAKEQIIRQQIDYVIVPVETGTEEFFEATGCTLICTTNSYQVYRYDYSWYNRVTDEATVEKIKRDLSIQEDKIELNLGLSKTYTILTLNDLHIEAMDSTVQEAYKQTVIDRFSVLFVNPMGVHSMDMWNGISSILDSYNADGIVFIGDIIDYCSNSNSEVLKKGLDKLNTPYIYLRADHDLGVWYTDGNMTSEQAKAISSEIAEWSDVYVVDYNEFYLVGWNNSTSQLSREGLNQAKDIFQMAKQEDKPILLMTHVPINSVVDDSLENYARTVDGQGRAKLWGEDCLYQPDETTQEFLDMVLAEDSPVKVVVAGHLHFKYVTLLNDKITEYVMDTGYRGNIGKIYLK